ncbi:MAG: 50S ribosomal protein L5 [Chloroflexi bacterium]|nr:50S ribosomal protein L5 [Chloroflexota bacterium]
MAEKAQMQLLYEDEVRPAMIKEFGYDSVMQTPKIVKVVVNIGLGEALQDARALDNAVGDLTTITGQKPIVTRSKKSVANFKLRENQAIGAKVTLRRTRMYHFLEKLFNVVFPRIRDFRGVSPNAFDGRGNYSVGLREQLVFPEINYDKVDRVRGLEVTIVTSAQTDEESRFLLRALGMPLAQEASQLAS